LTNFLSEEISEICRKPHKKVKLKFKNLPEFANRELNRLQMVTAVSSLSPEQQRLWRECTIAPKVIVTISPKFPRNAALFVGDIGVAQNETNVLLKQVDLDIQHIRKFAASLQTYFPKAGCHRVFPAKTGKATGDALASQLQLYFEAVLKIPGICIFHPLVELFAIDPTTVRLQ
jgi:antitoxin component HigA of HigAB toxin-antitoxin module